MSRSEKLPSAEADSILEEEDEATLFAIEEGIRQADDGQLLSAEEVRQQIPNWISKFSTPQEH